MSYIVASCVMVLAVALSYVALNKELATKVKLFNASDIDENFTSKDISPKTQIVICAMIAAVAFLVTAKVCDYVSNPIGIAKMLIAFICMTGASCFDFREKRIPNIFPLIMAVSAIILLLLGVILKQNGAVQYLTGNIISAVVCGILFFIAAFITGQGIGAGDIKLIIALALLGGVYTIVGTLLYGVLACSVVAVLALLFKKKKIKESLPFGPFLYVGFIITVFFMNF